MHYLSPELCLMKDTAATGTYDAQAADMWASGVVLYSMFTKGLPWDKASLRDPNYSEHVAGRTK